MYITCEHLQNAEHNQLLRHVVERQVALWSSNIRCPDDHPSCRAMVHDRPWPSMTVHGRFYTLFAAVHSSILLFCLTVVPYLVSIRCADDRPCYRVTVHDRHIPSIFKMLNTIKYWDMLSDISSLCIQSKYGVRTTVRPARRSSVTVHGRFHTIFATTQSSIQKCCLTAVRYLINILCANDHPSCMATVHYRPWTVLDAHRHESMLLAACETLLRQLLCAHSFDQYREVLELSILWDAVEQSVYYSPTRPLGSPTYHLHSILLRPPH